MRRFSDKWFAALGRGRFGESWKDLTGPRAPVVPWIAPPLHPFIRKAFTRYGTVREFEAGSWLYSHVQVHSFMYVESGLTGRVAASLEGQAGAGAMALSAPMRNASGNLNWITGRAAIGRYMAISNVRVREIPHDVVQNMVWHLNSRHYLLLLAQTELINLSDRMGFSILALLPALDRLKALFISMALYFGELFTQEGRLMTRFPIPGRKTHMANVIRVSDVTLDSLLATLRLTAHYRIDGDFIELDVEELQSVHEWMRYADGSNAFLTRPRRIEDMLAGAQQGDAFLSGG